MIHLHFIICFLSYLYPYKIKNLSKIFSLQILLFQINLLKCFSIFYWHHKMPVIEFILRDSAFHRKSNISAVYHISFSEFLSLWGQTPMCFQNNRSHCNIFHPRHIWLFKPIRFPLIHFSSSP